MKTYWYGGLLDGSKDSDGSADESKAGEKWVMDSLSKRPAGLK